MKTSRRVWSVALVLTLVAGLGVVGSDPAEAKKKPKPPPPEWNWEVEVPYCDSDYNLCGDVQIIYADTGEEDGVWVDASREGARGGEVSRLGFAVFECEPGEDCYGSSPKPVTLRDIVLDSDWAPPDEELPSCVFPGTCGEGLPPVCLQCFVNGQHPHDTYRYISFDLTVPGDFREIEIGAEAVLSGEFTMEIINTWDTLIIGDEEDHMVYSNVDLPGVGGNDVTVTRLGEDTWQVVVNVADVTPRMRFVESYVGCFKPPNKKGNCPWEYKHPIWAWTSEPLTFQATWTRTPAP